MNIIKELLRFPRFTYKGRSSRKEFWVGFLQLVLFFLIASKVLAGFDKMNLFSPPAVTSPGLLNLLKAVQFLFNLGYVVAVTVLLYLRLPITVRRLHDINKSGWQTLFFLIPFLGEILFFFWMLRKGNLDENAYGENPLAVKILA